MAPGIVGLHQDESNLVVGSPLSDVHMNKAEMHAGFRCIHFCWTYETE